MSKNKIGLNQKQKMFCELYAEPGVYFGNGVQAYIEAYGIDVTRPNAYASAGNSAYELLKNPEILSCIRDLLELGPLNPETVDRELALVIYQNADLKAKVSGIGEFNKVHNRVVTRLDHTTGGKPIGTLTPEARAILDRAAGHATED